MSVYLDTRRYKLEKADGYKIKSKGLIESWKVIDCKFIPILYIDDVKVFAPRKDKYIISMPEIREYIRNIECPIEIREQQMDKLEMTIYFKQLEAIELYMSLENTVFFNSIFTRDLDVKISFGENGPDEVEVEEYFWNRKKEEETINQTSDDQFLQEEIKRLKLDKQLS